MNDVGCGDDGIRDVIHDVERPFSFRLRIVDSVVEHNHEDGDRHDECDDPVKVKPSR